MNADLYYDIKRKVTTGETRKDADEWRKQLLTTARKTFEVEKGILYKQTEDGRQIVIQEKNKNSILHQGHDLHLSGHMGWKNTYYRLK
jgi:hypothetical protein